MQAYVKTLNPDTAATPDETLSPSPATDNADLRRRSNCTGRAWPEIKFVFPVRSSKRYTPPRCHHICSMWTPKQILITFGLLNLLPAAHFSLKFKILRIKPLLASSIRRKCTMTAQIVRAGLQEMLKMLSVNTTRVLSLPFSGHTLWRPNSKKKKKKNHRNIKCYESQGQQSSHYLRPAVPKDSW